MIRTVSAIACAALLAAGAPLRAQESFDELARRALARIDGEIRIRGLRDTVRVLRDPWGVPHIYANSIDDLFFAQGFVHAQDRLWQMDMYHRTFAGRLSEILGPDALRHDRLARLLRFRGPFDDAEFTSYHPEGRRIFQAFADGVNAYITHAGDNLPVEFIITGLRPLPWTAETPLLRTQTAMPAGDARSELSLAQDVVELGVEEANRRARPSPYRDLAVPRGVDLAIIGNEAARGLAGLQTRMPEPPLLPQYANRAGALPTPNLGAQENSPGSNNWVVSGRLTASGRVMLANDPHRNVGNPSIRYIVHLNAPGWNVIGSTEAPLPGVAIGHNGRIAWGLTIVGTDQSDVYVEEVHPQNRNLVRWQGDWVALHVTYDSVYIRGQDPVLIELKYSRHGPIFFEDTVNHRAYAMRSTMHEPGTAGYLGALRYHAIEDCRAFLDAQVYWKAPTENMICGDAEGNIAWQASALSPRRDGWDGRLPVPGTGEYEWAGFRDDLPREFNPERGWIATANHDIHPPGYDPPLFFKRGRADARYNRLAEVLSSTTGFTLLDFQALQHDAYSASDARDVEMFRGWQASNPDLEAARAMIARWNAVYRRESAAAALFSYVDNGIDDDVRNASPAERRTTLENALAQGLAQLRNEQGTDPAHWRWGRENRSEMPHSLIGAFDIPAIERSGGAGTVAAIGATYRQIVDFAYLDGSLATNLPGQSGQPGSPFYDNLVETFAAGQYFPLIFSREMVEARAMHRLVMVPGL